jgi:hypothetical protein
MTSDDLLIAPFIRRAAEEAAKAAAEAAAIEAAASKERAVAGAAAAAAGAAAAAAKAKEMQAALAAGAVSQQEAAVVMHEAAVVAMEAKTAAVEQQIVAAAAIQVMALIATDCLPHLIATDCIPHHKIAAVEQQIVGAEIAPRLLRDFSPLDCGRGRDTGGDQLGTLDKHARAHHGAMSPSPQVAINSGPSEAEARATKVRGDLATKLATSMQVLTSAPCPLAAGARRSRDETCVWGDGRRVVAQGGQSCGRDREGGFVRKRESGLTRRAGDDVIALIATDCL